MEVGLLFSWSQFIILVLVEVFLVFFFSRIRDYL